MGILNVTPDSFSDGGRFHATGAARTRAAEMVGEGAALIDVGGESTRPGAAPVSVDEELERVIPAVEWIVCNLDVAVSVDTGTPAVMRAAAAAGAHLINDVRALRRPGAMAAAAASGLPVCLMHMQGEPATMQQDPRYRDVVAEVRDFLLERVSACLEAGIPREKLLLDPGFGFGKTLEHNLALLQHLDVLVATGLPVLAGLSRKSMLGAILGGRPLEGRLHASVAASLLAATRGACILRVHDVGPTVDALAVLAAVTGSD